MDPNLPDPWADDCLNRKRFGELLFACLQSEAVFADEAFVVALTGKFGSGKSYFLDMWAKDLLLKVGKNPEKFPMVVTVNAWESDFSGEPLLALVSAISNQLRATRKGKEEEAVKDLKRGLAGAVGVAKWALGGLIEEKIGVPPEEVAAAFIDGASGEELDRRANALLSEFKARKQSLEKLRSSLQLLIDTQSSQDGKRELKLILIVDELDRCHPRYAIEFLEAVKHVFNVRGLAVVLGVDWGQLGCTASALFGHNLDTEEYLRKFIKRKVPLPPSSERASFALSDRMGKKYFPEGSAAWRSISAVDSNASRLLSALFHALGLSPRNQEAAFHLLASFLQLDANQNGIAQQRHNYLGEFLCVGLWIQHSNILAEFMNSRDARPFLKFIRSLDLGRKLNEARFRGDFIEGRLIGYLKDQFNNDSFDSLVDEAGYLVPQERGGEERYQEFRSSLKQTSVHEDGRLRWIARRVVELDLFER